MRVPSIKINPPNIHASCVSFGGNGLLIIGPSGSGKSALALELMALGGDLVADDQTKLNLVDGLVIARCPPEIRGKIEARGVGILAAEAVTSAVVRLVVDLGLQEPDRLPQLHTTMILGQTVPLMKSPGQRHFPAALVQYLKGGRIH